MTDAFIIASMIKHAERAKDQVFSISYWGMLAVALHESGAPTAANA